MLATLRARLETLYGSRLSELVLYGSQARGDAEQGSDIDVLVVLKGSISPCREIATTEDIVSDTSLEFRETIACAFVSEEQFNHERSPLLLNIRREGVAI